jgi:hypothetical protein
MNLQPASVIHCATQARLVNTFAEPGHQRKTSDPIGDRFRLELMANGGSSVAQVDALSGDPGDRLDVILTNPPFGNKSSSRWSARKARSAPSEKATNQRVRPLLPETQGNRPFPELRSRPLPRPAHRLPPPVRTNGRPPCAHRPVPAEAWTPARGVKHHQLISSQPHRPGNHISDYPDLPGSACDKRYANSWRARHRTIARCAISGASILRLRSPSFL